MTALFAFVLILSASCIAAGLLGFLMRGRA